MANQGCPANVPCIIPYLVVKDADVMLDFYKRAFGFQPGDAVKGDDGKTCHAEMRYKDMMLMFAPEGAYGSQTKSPATLGIQSPTTQFVYCEDVDALCKRAEGAGAQVAMQPADMFWGDRMCSLVDPSGHIWNFATHLEEK